jgi:hypothetical protein
MKRIKLLRIAGVEKRNECPQAAVKAVHFTHH